MLTPLTAGGHNINIFNCVRRNLFWRVLGGSNLNNYYRLQYGIPFARVILITVSRTHNNILLAKQRQARMIIVFAFRYLTYINYTIKVMCILAPTLSTDNNLFRSFGFQNTNTQTYACSAHTPIQRSFNVFAFGK